MLPSLPGAVQVSGTLVRPAVPQAQIRHRRGGGDVRGGVGTTSIWMYSVRGTLVPPVTMVKVVGLALTYLT